MRLPFIANPEHYVGLYVYDFGTRVSVGYTAAEVRVLRESKTHRNGTAYEIYRVADNGGFELRGATDQRLSARDAICFLRADESAAKRDYENLLAAATRHPLPCLAELHLTTVADLRPPYVTGVVFPVAASAPISAWLGECADGLGDRVEGGAEALAMLTSANDAHASYCRLPTLIEYADRAAEKVLAAVERSVQR